MLQEMASVYKTILDHQLIARSSDFLPMMCSRSSFKDVRRVTAGSAPSYDKDDDEDPLSPEVGCLGQVKRSNRVIGYLTPNGRITVAARAGGGEKYSKLRKMFSSAAVTKPAATPAMNTSRVAGRSTVATQSRKISCKKVKAGTISIIDMDPPLPVTRKVRKDGGAAGDDGEDRDNLWKRRSGGRMDLKKLELQKTSHRGPQHLQLLTV